MIIGRSTDKLGTTHKTCPDYKQGRCWNEECKLPGKEMCIGTRLCEEFWKWFLKEHCLLEN